MKATAPNESVISEDVKELAAELWKNSMGLSNLGRGWSPPMASFQKEVELKVQALLNASTARLREELITRGMEIAAERERVDLLKAALILIRDIACGESQCKQEARQAIYAATIKDKSA